MHLETLSDNHLINLTLDNHKDAFGVLYERHYKQLLEFADYIILENAEDIVTQTFISTYLKLGSHNPNLSFIYFLYRNCISQIKKENKRLKLYKNITKESLFFFQHIQHFKLYQIAQIYKTSVTLVILNLEYSHLKSLCFRYMASVYNKRKTQVKIKKDRYMIPEKQLKSLPSNSL